MKLKGYNAQAIIRDFQTQLSIKNIGIYQTMSTFRNGHYVLKPNNYEAPSFYVIYKRDWFMSFEKQFADFVEENPQFAGIGESINEDCLLTAIKRNCAYVVFIHTDSVYLAPSRLLVKFCEKYCLVRSQNRLNGYLSDNCTGKMKLESERTFSFPKCILSNFDEVFK